MTYNTSSLSVSAMLIFRYQFLFIKYFIQRKDLINMGNSALLEYGFKRRGYFCSTVRVVFITTMRLCTS